MVEYTAHEVNAVSGRCVVKGIVFGMDVILEHGGCEIHGIAQQVFPDDDNSHPGRAQVFLRARKEQTELCDVDFLGQNGGGHIPHQRNIAHIGQLCPACAVTGVV